MCLSLPSSHPVHCVKAATTKHAYNVSSSQIQSVFLHLAVLNRVRTEFCRTVNNKTRSGCVGYNPPLHSTATITPLLLHSTLLSHSTATITVLLHSTLLLSHSTTTITVLLHSTLLSHSTATIPVLLHSTLLLMRNLETMLENTEDSQKVPCFL
jgi:hypothetical protein